MYRSVRVHFTRRLDTREHVLEASARLSLRLRVLGVYFRTLFLHNFQHYRLWDLRHDQYGACHARLFFNAGCKMQGWINEHLTPAVTALIVGVFVPIIVTIIRKRRAMLEITDSLSVGEARFRADIILRLNDVQKRYDAVRDELIECEHKHALALIELEKLIARVAVLEAR